MPISPLDVFAILLMTTGPLKPTIIFAAAMASADDALRLSVARRTVLVAGGILLLFAFLGHGILSVFHITLPALQLAGGIVLLLFALELVTSARIGTIASGDIPPTINIAITPLAMPLVATPQGIVAVVTIAAAEPSPEGLMVLSAIVVAIMGLDYLCLRFSSWIVRAIGEAGIVILARIAGLLLAAMAMQLMILAGEGLGLIDRIRP